VVKKVHKPSDILKAGETVEAVVLSVKQRSGGLRWTEAGLATRDGRGEEIPVGSAIEDR